MNKGKQAIKTLAILMTLFLVACGEKNGGLEINNAGKLPNVKQLIENSFGAEKEVFELNIEAEEHLTSTFESASVKYLEGGKQYAHSYNKIMGEGKELQAPKMASAAFQKEFFLKKCQGKVKVKDFDYGMISTKYEEAIKMIPAEYGNFELHSWQFTVNNKNEVSAKFVIEGTKKSEGKSLQGRNIVTNYYEFPFKMDSKGKLAPAR